MQILKPLLRILAVAVVTWVLATIIEAVILVVIAWSKGQLHAITLDTADVVTTWAIWIALDIVFGVGTCADRGVTREPLEPCGARLAISGTAPSLGQTAKASPFPGTNAGLPVAVRSHFFHRLTRLLPSLRTEGLSQSHRHRHYCQVVGVILGCRRPVPRVAGWKRCARRSATRSHIWGRSSRGVHSMRCPPTGHLLRPRRRSSGVPGK